jgi:single-stranded DNA-binding protein
MFNNVTLIGYLGSDAESRPIRDNSTLTVRSLATKRTLVRPEAYSAVRPKQAFVPGGPRFKFAAHLQIVGEIQTREYTAKDGINKFVTEISVHRIVRLDRASNAESTEGAAA